MIRNRYDSIRSVIKPAGTHEVLKNITICTVYTNAQKSDTNDARGDRNMHNQLRETMCDIEKTATNPTAKSLGPPLNN